MPPGSQPRLQPAPAADPFLSDVIAGLSAKQKSIPPKYFYDQQGSRLFDDITALPEYYLTRAEIAILQSRSGEIAQALRNCPSVVEFGSGSARKARILLQVCPWVEIYAPCDISGEFLVSEMAELSRARPNLKVLPVVADFSTHFTLPGHITAPRAGLFLGSTIGNFDPQDAGELLKRFARTLGAGAHLIVGVDLVKDETTLVRAYDDASGVTADFNLNLLSRINRELGGDFQRDAFQHRAIFNRELSRIEMHLVSRQAQTIRVGGRSFAFAEGETIHTESSYKYSRDSFRRLASTSGWTPAQTWTDEHSTFSLHELRNPRFV